MFRTFRILPEDAALELFERLSKADWQVGKARTADAVGTIKRNEEIIPRTNNEPFFTDVLGVRNAMLANADFMAHTLTFKMTVPKFNRYQGGGTYRRHFDASPMSAPDMRTDWSYTMFLTPPGDYDGGELNVEDLAGAVHTAPKGAPGECVVYDCGAAHWVNPVTRGARISCIGWLRSLVRDPLERRMISQFGEILKRAEKNKAPIEPYSDDFTTLTGIQTQLCRKWMDA